MPQLSPHLKTVPGSGIRRIFEIALNLEGVTFLAVGEPDMPIAPHIAEAAKRAWDDDDTNYTANAGIPALRHAFADRFAAVHGAALDPERVWVTVGGTQALHQAVGLVLGPGDEVLVPDPGYTTFSMSPRMLSAVPVPYALRPEAAFLPEIERLEQLITPRTRALIVNSPSNPLGTVVDEALARELLAFAERHDLWVISDEVYEQLTWGGPHVSLTALDTAAGGGRVLGVFSLSKTYAMTGIRIGFLITPRGIDHELRTVQEAMIACVSVPDQRAGVAALAGDQSAVEAARTHYRGNLEAATALLDERGIRYREPDGAFYLWIDVSHASGGDVAAWAERFLREQLVAVAPGSAFGAAGEGWIRVCAAASRADLLHGLSLLPAP
ncbi:pyridoxal phosphate-dependent aminotransferase [Microbacterium fluvii]|uniref:Aminotransferase n=1 Tax=Microbacterium fluvii TaxID=415215 RepID=A0ABW2HD31_9MICO|nr:aminotransferase class I/II-fold pyridoxal phosphate-dependent enzyme [Microbacterium fluvii]MCU4671299.1 aminotransferase class I/II-fold pyridoxal phosphate-dependent enzyme [Microbacterium fluvii]